MEWEGISTRPITISPSTGYQQFSNHELVTGNGHILYRDKISSAGSLIRKEIMDTMDSFMTE